MVLLFLLMSCTGEKPDDDTAKNQPDDSSGDTAFSWDDAPDPTKLLGGVQIIEQPSDWDSVVYVEFWATPLPSTQAIVAQDGDCILLSGEPMNSWDCTPECEYGAEACIDGECVPYPDRAPSGTVRIEGLKVGTLTLEPAELGLYVGDFSLEQDLFDVNDAISVTSTGDLTPAVDLAALGVEDLQSQLQDIVPGEDLPFSWTPPTTDAPSRIQILLQTGWHGSPSLTSILCETEDDGDFVVPAALTAEFPIPACGACEASYIRRFTRDVVDFGQGPIQLFVAWQRPFVAWMTGL